MTPRATLNLGPGLILPADVATESIGVLGQRGSGKSNVLVVLAEELYRLGVPWVAVDPKGDWHGIRSSADGRGPGLPIPVFGGLHGDLPLEANAGAYIAELLVSHTISAVLDVSRLSAGDLAKFLIAFCHRLFDLHQAEPHVRMVLFEEAHRYISQSVTSATAALKEATAKIPLEGRAFGLGSAAASQRSSRLHKDVLTQFSVLIAMRSPAKLDRDAIAGWTEEHAINKEVLATLSELDNGEGWLWSPQVLHRAERVKFRQRSTFDTGATPKVGQARRLPGTIADIDIAAIKAAMIESIERAKADDPKELRQRIAQLERQLREAPAPEAVEPSVVEIEVPVFSEDLVIRLEEALSPFAALLSEVQDRLDWQVTRADEAVKMRRALAKDARRQDRTMGPAAAQERRAVTDNQRATAASLNLSRRAATRAETDAKLGKAEKATLTVLAQHPAGRTAPQLCMQTGYTWSGGFRNALASLRTAGYMEGANKDVMRITEAGVEALGDWEPLPSGRALLEHWLGRLGKAEKGVLARLVALYPQRCAGTELAEALGYEWSGGFRNALSKLRTLQLVDGSNAGGIAAADELMEAIS